MKIARVNLKRTKLFQNVHTFEENTKRLKIKKSSAKMLQKTKVTRVQGNNTKQLTKTTTVSSSCCGLLGLRWWEKGVKTLQL